MEEIIGLTGLMEKQKSMVGTLSGGQRQRLALAVALLNRPKILFLDEPTTGLDPHSRFDFWNILKELKARGETTLILTTHYMEEAESLCDRIIIMDEGLILREGKLEELLDGNARNLDELFINLTGKTLREDTNVIGEEDYEINQKYPAVSTDLHVFSGNHTGTGSTFLGNPFSRTYFNRSWTGVYTNFRVKISHHDCGRKPVGIRFAAE
jgi:ABC-type multidrug transport system ATPase subunit